MDYCAKLYIDFTHNKNRYYDDAKLEMEISEAEKKFIEKLSDDLKLDYEDLKRLQKQLRAYKDLHLIRYVLDQPEKKGMLLK